MMIQIFAFLLRAMEGPRACWGTTEFVEKYTESWGDYQRGGPARPLEFGFWNLDFLPVHPDPEGSGREGSICARWER
jgi:hypothetical protein